MSSREYAERVANNTDVMMREVAHHPDGTNRDLPSDVVVGLLVAQSSLAIAAALQAVAEAIREGDL